MEMSHVVDLTGSDFGYLHVIGRDTSKKRRHGTLDLPVQMRDHLQQGRKVPPERACKKLRLLPERTRGHARHQEGSSQKAKSRTEEEKIRPRPAAGRLRDLLQPTLPDAQQLPRRLELHRMPLLPGTQICPPVEAGDHHNLKGVSKWQKSWARLRAT
jgi:hypothetical protein